MGGSSHGLFPISSIVYKRRPHLWHPSPSLSPCIFNFGRAHLTCVLHATTVAPLELIHLLSFPLSFRHARRSSFHVMYVSDEAMKMSIRLSSRFTYVPWWCLKKNCKRNTSNDGGDARWMKASCNGGWRLGQWVVVWLKLFYSKWTKLVATPQRPNPCPRPPNRAYPFFLQLLVLHPLAFFFGRKLVQLLSQPFLRFGNGHSPPYWSSVDRHLN